MCLIAHRERGANIPNAVIDHNRTANPDGFGIAWRDGKSLRHAKFGPGHDEYERFKALLKSIDKRTEVEYVAHWRTATHGAKCVDLSHPFTYTDKHDGDVLIFHNGIINISVPKGESDTSHFVKAVLAGLEPRWYRRDATRFLVEAAIGYSRLLVMTRDMTLRLNEGQWQKKNGIWYSTNPLPTYTQAGVKAYGGYGQSKWGDYRSWLDDDDDDEGGVLDLTERQTDLLIEGDPEDEVIEDAHAFSDGPAKGWYHMNHFVRPVREEEDAEGDLFGTAKCSVCNTEGEYYIIKNKAYIDVPHSLGGMN